MLKSGATSAASFGNLLLTLRFTACACRKFGNESRPEMVMTHGLSVAMKGHPFLLWWLLHLMQWE